MKKILVVDDQTTNLMLLEILLKGSFDTIPCADALKALQMFERYKVDMVITDLKMPGMDGFELIKRIRTINPDIPVLAMSAHTEYQQDPRNKKKIFDDFIAKPFSLDFMRHKVEQHLSPSNKTTSH